MENLFVFGTLKSQETRKKVLGRDVSSEKAVLPGYKATKIMIGEDVYSDLIMADDSKVYGILLKLDLDDLRKVDDYKTYRFRRARVMLANGQSAHVYVRA